MARSAAVPAPFVCYLRVYEPLGALKAPLAARVRAGLARGAVPVVDAGRRDREVCLRAQLAVPSRLLPGERADGTPLDGPADVLLAEGPGGTGGRAGRAEDAGLPARDAPAGRGGARRVPHQRGADPALGGARHRGVGGPLARRVRRRGARGVRDAHRVGQLDGPAAVVRAGGPRRADPRPAQRRRRHRARGAGPSLLLARADRPTPSRGRTRPPTCSPRRSATTAPPRSCATPRGGCGTSTRARWSSSTTAAS